MHGWLWKLQANYWGGTQSVGLCARLLLLLLFTITRHRGLLRRRRIMESTRKNQRSPQVETKNYTHVCRGGKIRSSAVRVSYIFTGCGRRKCNINRFRHSVIISSWRGIRAAKSAIAFVEIKKTPVYTEAGKSGRLQYVFYTRIIFLLAV